MGQPSIIRTILSEDLISEIHSSDQSIYPAPLTYERLKSWVEGCPELSIAYKVSKGIFLDENIPLAGIIIVLPVKAEHWQDILIGRLKETDIEPNTFANDTGADTEAGLHIFHIEKFAAWSTEREKLDGIGLFAEFALQDVRAVAVRKGWKVLGYSGRE
jgi:hypothetical protein